MAHRFRDPASPTPNDPAAPGGHDHHHRFLRRLSGAQVRSASRPEGHLDRTTAPARFCYRANSHRRNQPNLCGMMWLQAPSEDGDEGDLDEGDEVLLRPLEDRVQPPVPADPGE